MRRFLRLLLLPLLLTACPYEPWPEPEPQKLPFATDPSVLRGDWVAPLGEFPTVSQLKLNDITANCDDADGDVCKSYSFSGTLQIDEGEAVTFTGEGNAGYDIYTLASPIYYGPPMIRAEFTLDGVLWELNAEYYNESYSYDNSDEVSPVYSGYICQGGPSCAAGRSVRLEPAN